MLKNHENVPHDLFPISPSHYERIVSGKEQCIFCGRWHFGNFSVTVESPGGAP